MGKREEAKNHRLSLCQNHCIVESFRRCRGHSPGIEMGIVVVDVLLQLLRFALEGLNVLVDILAARIVHVE